MGLGALIKKFQQAMGGSTVVSNMEAQKVVKPTSSFIESSINQAQALTPKAVDPHLSSPLGFRVVPNDPVQPTSRASKVEAIVDPSPKNDTKPSANEHSDLIIGNTAQKSVVAETHPTIVSSDPKMAISSSVINPITAKTPNLKVAAGSTKKKTTRANSAPAKTKTTIKPAKKVVLVNPMKEANRKNKTSAKTKSHLTITSNTKKLKYASSKTPLIENVIIPNKTKSDD